MPISFLPSSLRFRGSLTPPPPSNAQTAEPQLQPQAFERAITPLSDSFFHTNLEVDDSKSDLDFKDIPMSYRRADRQAVQVVGPEHPEFHNNTTPSMLVRPSYLPLMDTRRSWEHSQPATPVVRVPSRVTMNRKRKREHQLEQQRRAQANGNEPIKEDKDFKRKEHKAKRVGHKLRLNARQQPKAFSFTLPLR